MVVKLFAIKNRLIIPWNMLAPELGGGIMIEEELLSEKSNGKGKLIEP
jgi:hypothetical protein